MSAAILAAFALSHIVVWVVNRGVSKSDKQKAQWTAFLAGYRLCAIGKATIK